MDKLNKKCNRFNKRITFLILNIIIIANFLMLFNAFGLNFDKKPNTVSVAFTGSSAIVMEQSSKRVLYGENVDTKLPMASTTKILTALVVLEYFDDINSVVKIPKEAVGIEGSSIYLRQGEEISIKDLLYGLMLRSGNDSAVALAIATAGSLEAFAKLMNDTAKNIGAVNSNFVNPHGLHNDLHYTTAYDLGLITCKAMENSVFCEITATQFIKTNGNEPRYFENKNKMLKIYDGANGVKTGYTKRAGRCLVSSAIRNDMQLVSVVINHGSMWQDSISMLDNAFSKYKMYNILNADEYQTTINVKNGKYAKVLAKPNKTMLYPLTEKEYNNLEIKTKVTDFVTAPVKMGENVGSVEVYNGNCLLFVCDFTTMHSVDKKSFRFKLK